jgi:hypothetical protein
MAFALVAGAAHAQPPKDTQKEPQKEAVEEMAPAEVTRWIAFFDKLVEAVVANEQSCDKMANDVAAVIDANKSSIAMVRTARDHGKKLPLSAQHHMIDGVKKMTPGIENCSNNEKVKAAFAKLETAGESTESARSK